MNESGRCASTDIVADLHVHTTASDGTLTIEEVPAVAADAGLSWIAVTDHDRVHPQLDAPVVDAGPVTVVRGIELRVETETQRLDLLGYAVDSTGPLLEEVARLQENRIERARRMVNMVEDRLGVELDVTFEPGVGRPHIARAIERSAAPIDYVGAFDDLIGNDGPCFVPRDVPSFEYGVRILRESCAFVGLAHPFRYADVEDALSTVEALDAIEGCYPYDHPVDYDHLENVAREYDLLVTGGSDAHERTVGTAGLDGTAFEPIRNRFPDPG